MDIADVKVHVTQEVESLCEGALDAEDSLPEDWDALANALADMSRHIANQMCRIAGWAGYTRVMANKEKKKRG